MELLESSFTNKGNLQFRMWKMVDDMYHHTLRGYGGAPSEVEPIKLYDIPNIQDMVDMYDGPMNASSLTTWFMLYLLPSLTNVYFANKLPKHESFVSMLPKRLECIHDDFRDDDDIFDALELEDAIEWEEFDEHVVKSLIEGYLRISLLVYDDDVLCNGYDVKFTCRAFGEWLGTFLVEAMDMLKKE